MRVFLQGYVFLFFIISISHPGFAQEYACTTNVKGIYCSCNTVEAMNEIRHDCGPKGKSSDE
jgi:hypothetical protein